eukprot:scaffold2926_cov176-Skeletonema_menzelii.AAC.1
MHQPHALGGVMNGSFLHRGSRGSCLVLSSTPTLWPFVVRALGFDLASLTTKDAVFKSVVGDVHPRVVGGGDSGSVQAVFGSATEMSRLPRDHWVQHRVPHVCTLEEEESLPHRKGWVSNTCDFLHNGMGGVTNASFRMGVSVPEERHQILGQPAPFPRQAAASLWNVMDSTVHAAAVTDTDTIAWLERTPADCARPQFYHRLLDPRGVAPRKGLETMKVLAPCVFSPTKWGVRQLSSKELAGVFDVPILMQERLMRMGPAGEQLMRGLCKGHPGKVLHLGGDHLLSLFCRGGWSVGTSGVSDGVRNHREEHQNTLNKIRVAAEDAARLSKMDKGDLLIQGIKQDGQKADDAEVPTHLWDGMWMRSRNEQGFGSMESWMGKPLDTNEGEDQPRWRQALEVMRDKWLLQRWRRNVTKSFCDWFADSVMMGRRSHERPVVRWSERRKVGDRAEPGYVWTYHGRGDYKRWWESLRQKRHGDIMESGREAIERATSATWWDWAGGSSLFFWRWPISHVRWAREGQPHFTTASLPNYKKPQRKAPSSETQELMNAKVNKVRWRRYICLGPVCSLTHMFSVPKGLHDIRMVYDGTKSGLNDCLFAPHFSLPVMAHTLRSLLKGYYGADLDMMIMAKFIAYGDRTDESNPFRWESVVLNLPGDPDYDPTLPWVMKVRKDGHLASEMLEEDETALPRKALEKARGFLIYVGRTYRWMNPYLKGLHLTIDGWRPDRDEEGYRIKKRNRGREIEDELRWKEEEEAFERGEREDLEKHEEGEEDQEAPETVRAAPRFRGDIDALLQLTAGEEPAIQRCRVEGSMTAVYLGGDASGKGFGAAMWDDEEVVYSAGSWNATHSQESSNWREATNLTLKVEEMAAEGRLDGKELWIFTDNSTYESAFYKGEPWTAPRPKGDDDQEKRAFWSRGRGNRWESELLVKLDPGDWFRLQEIKGHRLWIPPPAAMETVMELFAEDHLVNPHLAHVFIVPRLMTHLWRRQLFRDADVHFYVYAGAPFWPRSMHEPLTVAIVFPLAHVP